MKVLVTGFDPFGGEKINPAWEAVHRLADSISGARIIKAQIPTVFHRSIALLQELITREEPELVICVGQAGGRAEIGMERVAINIDDARIKDNEGNQPVDQAIFADGREAYFSTLPIKAMTRALQDGEIPAAVTNSAGTFVCNHLMYGLLYTLDQNSAGRRGGFIHVPYIPDQVADKPETPAMELAEITRGLTLAIAAAVENPTDITAPGGRIC